jgi:hypothetical protein
MANGIIIWEGASELDGAPIMVVATGLSAASANVKTGALVQTWILRADIAPMEAVHAGADSSICGACPHRGTVVDGRNVGRSCYVTVWQAPRNVYATTLRGRYARPSLDESRAMLAGMNVRLGAYGDPAAVPLAVWDSVLADAARGTGYTHQWRTCAPGFAAYCMASADSAEEAEEARAAGYRTFRVGTPAERIVKGAEFLCPASAEAGKVATCATCLACGGTRAPNRASVFIPVHGTAAHKKNFKEGRAE